jgi:hypothetical protein
MNSRLLLGFLVASVSANVALYLYRHPADSAQDAGPPTSAAAHAAGAAQKSTSANSAGATPAAQPVVWTAPAPTPDALRAYAADLRRAGFPPRVIAQLVRTLLRDQAMSEAAQLPFWRLTPSDPEFRRRQSAAEEKLQRQLEEILGADGTPAALLDPAARAQRYGSLPDAKVNALLRIERDFQELSSGVNLSGPASREEFEARSAQLALLEKERRADIAAALTPEEFAAWELRSSGTALRVQNAARNLTLSEEEYRAVFAAQKEFEPNLGMNFFSSLGNDPRLAERNALNEKLRATLGDERFDTYLRSYDPNYANVATFTDKQPGLTRAQTYSLYQLQLEAQAALAAQSRNVDSGQRPSSAETQKTWGALNARLDELLGPTAAEAYRATGGGSYFKMFRPAGPRSTMPAIQLPPKS